MRPSSPLPKEPWRDVELDRLRIHRRRRLHKAGVRGVQLDLLTDSQIPVHDLEDLVSRGCPPDTAARILL